jgi:hypothetical protein
MDSAELKLASQPKPEFLFTHSPLMNKIHLLQIDMNPYLKMAMDNDLTDDLYQDLDYRIENERNFDMVIHGETGSGKSTFAMSVYWETHKRAKKFLNNDLEFTADNVTFTRTEWLTRNEKLQGGDTLIFDEDDQSIIGVGALRQLSEQERIEKTLRQSQYNYIFCSPIIEKHVEHYIFKTFDIDYGRQLTRAVLYKRDDTGLILPFGFVTLKKHDLPGYMAKKEKFRKAVQARSLRDRFFEYDDVAKALIEKFNIDKVKHLRTKKSIIQRFFPRFVEEEVKEIMTSIELITSGVNVDYSDF